MNNKRRMYSQIRSAKEQGQALVLIGLLMVALLASLGLAIDGGGMFLLYRDAQNAADAAALQAAFTLCTNGDPVPPATVSLRDNGFVDGANGVTLQVQNPPASGTYSGNPNYIYVEIEAEKPSYFIQIVYGGPLVVRTSATSQCFPSVARSSALDAAVVALRPTCDGSTPSLDIGGTADVTIYGSIFVNQDDNNCDSIDVRGASGVEVDGSICTLGDIDYNGANAYLAELGGNPNPDIFADSLSESNNNIVNTSSCTIPQVTNLPDPLGFSAYSAEDICGPRPSGTLPSIGNSGNFTPGYYSDITQQGPPSSQLNFAPGNYCIEGDITIKRIARGTDVFFFQSGTNAQFEITSQSDVEFTPASTGPFAGTLLYSQSQALSPFAFKFTAGSNFDVTGRIYVPEGHCMGRGGGGSIIYGQLMCWTVDLAGNSDTVIYWTPAFVPPEPASIGLTE